MELSASEPLGEAGVKPSVRLNQLIQQLPGYAGKLRVNDGTIPHSFVSLHRPTGKYVHRVLLRLASRLLEHGGVRTIGHAGAPGLILADLDPQRGAKQIPIWPKGYSAVAANVLGHPAVRDAVTVPAEPFMLLELDPSWTSFDDYLGAMKTKYRTRAKRALTLSAHCKQCECTNWPDGDWLNWAAELLGKTLADKVIALPEDLSELLAAFKGVYGADFHVLGYRHDGRWIGFITALREGQTLYALHMGFEPDFALEAQFYQRSMMDVVSLGIRLGVARVNMGRTATEIKSALGAKPVENSFVFMTTYWWMRWLVAGYRRWLLRLPNYDLRSPFKGDGTD